MMPWGWHGMEPYEKGSTTVPIKKSSTTKFITGSDVPGQMFAAPSPLKRMNVRHTAPAANGLSQYQFKSAAYDALLPFLDTYKSLKCSDEEKLAGKLDPCAEDKRQIVNIDEDRKHRKKRASPPLQGNEAQRGRVEGV